MPNCCVVGCNNNLKNSTVTLHNFPRKEKDPQRYRAWKNRVNRENFTPNHNHVVCSSHFKDDDFENKYIKELLPNEKVLRKLKNTAVPSVFLSAKKSAAGQAGATSIRISKYIRKRLVVEAEHEVEQKEESNTLNNDIIDTSNLEIEQSNKDIGVQCELGSEVFYKYSNIFENKSSSDESIHLTDLSGEESSDSDDDDNADDDLVLDINMSRKKRKRESDVSSDKEISESDTDQSNKIPEFGFVLVQTKALMSLFKNCNTCGLPLTKVTQLSRGCVLHVKYKCREGHCSKWASYEDSSKCAVHLSSALLLNGINFAPIANFAKTLKLLFISSNTYYKILNKNIAPVINDFWLKHKCKNYEEARADEDLQIAGDGQFDSPGFSAKYVTYSIMNIKTNKILDFFYCKEEW